MAMSGGLQLVLQAGVSDGLSFDPRPPGSPDTWQRSPFARQDRAAHPPYRPKPGSASPVTNPRCVLERSKQRTKGCLQRVARCFDGVIGPLFDQCKIRLDREHRRDFAQLFAIAGPCDPVRDELLGQFHRRCGSARDDHHPVHALRAPATANAEPHGRERPRARGVRDRQRVPGEPLIRESCRDLARVPIRPKIVGNGPEPARIERPDEAVPVVRRPGPASSMLRWVSRSRRRLDGMQLR